MKNKLKRAIVFISCACMLAGCNAKDNKKVNVKKESEKVSEKEIKKEKKKGKVLYTNADLLKMAGYREGSVTLPDRKIEVQQEQTEANYINSMCYRAFELSKINIKASDKKVFRKLASDSALYSDYQTLVPITEGQKRQMKKSVNVNDVKMMLFAAAVIKKENIMLTENDMKNGSWQNTFASIYKDVNAQTAVKMAMKKYYKELKGRLRS